MSVQSVADQLSGKPVMPSQPNAPAPLIANANDSVSIPIPVPAAPAAPAPDDEEHHAPDDDIPPELEVLLDTNPRSGLSTSEAERRLAQFGRNEIPEKKTNPVLKFLTYFIGPLAYLIEIACIISAVVGDWIDFGIILVGINASEASRGDGELIQPSDQPPVAQPHRPSCSSTPSSVSSKKPRPKALSMLSRTRSP